AEEADHERDEPADHPQDERDDDADDEGDDVADDLRHPLHHRDHHPHHDLHDDGDQLAEPVQRPRPVPAAFFLTGDPLVDRLLHILFDALLDFFAYFSGLGEELRHRHQNFSRDPGSDVSAGGHGTLPHVSSDAG